MVGGEASTLDAARPALEPFAGLVVHVGGPGMGQVVKLCNNLIYAAQMLAVSEATVMAQDAGVELGQLYEILTHATGDCVAVRTRLPAEGVVPDSPASNGWAPGFMTDLMAKDLDLAIDYAARCRRPAVHLRDRAPDPRRDERGRVRPGRLLGHGQGGADAGCGVTVLTLDLGTGATKAALWGDDGLVAITRAEVTTAHPQPGWAEQDPEDWWLAVVDACAQLRNEARAEYDGIESVGFSAARETFAGFDDELRPIGPGILWSDQRGAAAVLHFGDPDEFRARTGVVLNAACCAAKIAWVTDHEPEAFAAARWILAPRDFVIARLTGVVLTDDTLASRTGLYGLDGVLGVADSIATKLPDVAPAASLVPAFDAARIHGPDDLALPRGVQIVIGGGDRACEVLGRGRARGRPDGLVGHHRERLGAACRPDRRATRRGRRVARRARRVHRRGRPLGRRRCARLAGAHHRPPIRGPAHRGGRIPARRERGRRAPLAPRCPRAVVAARRARCVRRAHRRDRSGRARAIGRRIRGPTTCSAAWSSSRPTRAELVLAGGGAKSQLWRDVLAATSGRPLVRRAVDDAASAGARVVVGAATGAPVDLELVNPVVARDEPDPDLRDRYRDARRASDAFARAMLDLA